MKMRHLSGALFAAFLLAACSPLIAALNTAVIPANLDGVEGGSVFGILDPITFQLLYPASTLSELPSGAVISGMQLRQNSGQGVSNAITGSHFDVYLGQPTAATLDPDLATNEGPDTVLARSGSISFASDAFPNGGSPNGFGPVIAFTTTYTYTGGDLLLTISKDSFSAFLNLDLDLGPSGILYRASSEYNATTLSTSASNIGLPVQFIYAVPEPASATILFVGGLALLRRRRVG